MEDKLEKLANDRVTLLEQQNQKSLEEADIQYIINRCFYFLEHLEDTLLNGSNPQKSAALFSTIFDTQPTFEELKSRTSSIVAKMNTIFQLNEAYKQTGNLVVGD